MADASRLPDPTGAHELRYWNGSTWTEHVSDQGQTAQDPLTAELPRPADAYPPPPAPPPASAPAPAGGWAPPADAPPAAGASAAPAGGKLGWKDRLKQVADQGKAMADQGKQKLAEQQSKRNEQWANDTRDRVWIESGLLGTRTESVPLWAVPDMDIRQAVWQRSNDIGDVVLDLEDPAYGAQQDKFNLTGALEQGRTSGKVVLDNIEHPHQVYDILAPLVSEARQKKTMERQSTYVHNMTPGMPFGAPMAPPAPAAPPPPSAPPQADMVEQLKKLGELRDAGILTEEEFAAQKAKILGA